MTFGKNIDWFFLVIVIFLFINPLLYCNDVILNFEDTTISANLITQNFAKTGKIVLRNCNIQGPIKSKGDTIYASLDISNCNIWAIEILYGELRGSFTLDSSIINYVRTCHLKFRNDVSFRSTEFINDAHFGSNEFTKPAFFDSCKFNSNAYFMACDFHDVASFAATKFMKGVDFGITRFMGNGTIGIKRNPNEKIELGVESRVWRVAASFYDTELNKANFSCCIFNDAIFNPKRLTVQRIKYPRQVH